MEKVALAILVVGLCFYNAYLKVHGLNIDLVADFMALLGTIKLLLQ